MQPDGSVDLPAHTLAARTQERAYLLKVPLRAAASLIASLSRAAETNSSRLDVER